MDIDALIEFQTDRSSGVAREPHVYQTRLRTGRDLAVLILLDSTGSSAEESDAGARFDQHRAVAEQITHAMSEIGDRVATYGFYSRGRDSVRVLRVKSFDDAYDRAARERLADLRPTGFTRLGTAIRHSAMLLRTRAGTTNQLLLVVGDGFAYDDGYEDRYAREDTRRALREASASGIGCIGLRMAACSRGDVFDEIWSAWSSHVLVDLSGLAHSVRPVMTEALVRARSLQRRRP